MRIKQFYTNHRPLVEAMFWAFMTIMVLLFWPQPNIVPEIVEPSQIKMEVPPVIVELPITQPSPIPIPTPEPEPPQYGFTEDDIYLMSVLLTGSKAVDGDGEFDFDYGRDEEYDQIYLVLCVVMNRVRSGVYPNTVSEVIWQTGQFSLMPKWKKKLPPVSDISIQRVTDWCKAYDAHDPGVQNISKEHLYFSGDGKNNHSR